MGPACVQESLGTGLDDCFGIEWRVCRGDNKSEGAESRRC
jgi:hypothetical protein